MVTEEQYELAQDCEAPACSEFISERTGEVLGEVSDQRELCSLEGTTCCAVVLVEIRLVSQKKRSA
jgi:hypothetical protein